MKTTKILLQSIILLAALSITGFSCEKENEAVDDTRQGIFTTFDLVSYFSPHVWTKETYRAGPWESIAQRVYETDANGRVNAYTDDRNNSKVELEYY